MARNFGYTSDFLIAIMMRFFWKLSRRQHAAKITCVATLWRSPWFCRKKFNSLNFSRFFHLSHHLCEGGYTCDFLRALVTRQFKKKIATPSQAKNRSFSRGLIVNDFPLLFLLRNFTHLKQCTKVSVKIFIPVWLYDNCFSKLSACFSVRIILPRSIPEWIMRPRENATCLVRGQARLELSRACLTSLRASATPLSNLLTTSVQMLHGYF